MTPSDTPTKKEGNTIHMGTAILNLILGAGLLYSVVVAFVFLTQRDFMYFPDQTRPDPSASVAPEMKVVSYKTFDGIELSSWYYPPKNETLPVIVHFHGNAGNIASRASRARLFIDKGYGVLLAEYRGYGGNPGTPDEPKLMFDGKAAIDFIKEQGISTSRVVAYGESLGSGIVVSLAMDAAFDGEHFSAVVLEAPFSSAVDAGRAHYPFLPVGILMKDRFESTPRISAIRAPLLIVHGDKDDVIPIRLGKKLFSAALSPKQSEWISGAGHNNLYEFGAGDVVLEFIKKASLGGE